MKKFFLNWNRFPYKNIDIIIIGLAKIVDGVFCITTLGFWYPSLHSKWVFWRTKKMFSYKS